MPVNVGGLNETQVRQFLDQGWLVIPDCFDKKEARKWVQAAYARIGYDERRPKGWHEERVHIPSSASFRISEFAPKAWSAICALVGGVDRIEAPDLHSWLNSFIIKFPVGRSVNWAGPSAEGEGWHKDGPPDIAHFLDSREMGLLTFALWSEVKPRGGGTFLACDSIGPVARCLADHPEGVWITRPPFQEAIRSCRRFAEFTGQAGDVALLHPYLLHAESHNASDCPRVQTVRMITLKEPLNFSRRDTRGYSLVELAVLKSLGQRRLNFQRKHGAENRA